MIQAETTGRLLTIDDVSSRIVPHSTLRSSQDRAWPGIDAVQRRLATEYLVVPPMAVHTLVIITGQPVFVVGRVADQHFEGKLVHGSTTLIPASAESTWQYRFPEAKTHEVLHIYLKPTLLSQVADNLANPPSDVMSAIGVLDPQIDQIGQLLLAELTNGGIGGGLYAESLANMLAVHLLRRYSSPQSSATEKPSHGLSHAVLQQISTYIDEQLSSSILLADLAQVAHLSPYHFARMFRRAVGMSPYQYLLARRVERAKTLLHSSNSTLAEIAALVGFADQSHLTYHIRRQLGVTPSQLRTTARSS